MSTIRRDSGVGIHRLKLSGALNASRAADTIRCFREIAAQGIKSIVVDLEEVPFIDSRGLAALIAGYKIFGGDARNFQLVGVQDQPRLVFELTGFDRIFHTATTQGEDIAPEVVAAGQPIQVLPDGIVATLVMKLPAWDWAVL